MPLLVYELSLHITEIDLSRQMLILTSMSLMSFAMKLVHRINEKDTENADWNCYTVWVTDPNGAIVASTIWEREESESKYGLLLAFT